MFPQAVFDSDETLINRVEPLGNYRTIKLKPYEKSYGDIKALKKHMNESTWITTDLHTTSGDSRVDKVIATINDRVGDEGHLLILGDLGKATLTASMTRQYIESVVNSIKTKNKYLILGNHDVYSIDDYIQMGFKFISDELLIPWGNIKLRFTHIPIPVNKDTVNIHGHIHGSNEYWYTTRRHHYDAYINWDEEYVTRHEMTAQAQEGFPAVQQLGDLFKYYDHERCV